MSDWTDLIRQLELMKSAGWELHAVRGSGGADWHTVRVELRKPVSDHSHSQVIGGRQ